MPPSINAAYANNHGGGKGRRKSAAYLEFDKRAEVYCLKNAQALNAVYRAIVARPPNTVLRVDYRFWYARDQLFSKKGQMKKNDTSNRIKVVEDFLAKMFDIDDTFFWHGSFEKIVMDGCEPFVDVTIQFEEMKHV